MIPEALRKLFIHSSHSVALDKIHLKIRNRYTEFYSAKSHSPKAAGSPVYMCSQEKC